ncbi:hypothetical protein ACROYT_G026999 [Oculina patagonica]
MHKPQTRAIILPWWTALVLAAALVTLFPALLYCVREIVVLKSRVDEQQQTIESLESVTAQIRRRTVGDEISSEKANEAFQRFLKLEDDVEELPVRIKREAGNTCRCRRGPKGAQGQKGQKGVDGNKGEPGTAGPPGINGQKGDTGEMGDQGEPGAQGLPGSMIGPRDSAHIVGYGEHINPPTGTTKFHRITNWKLSHKTGSIKFVSNSFLVIGTAGYYFVYSQLFYYAGDTLFMGHYTYINEEPVMRSLSSVVSETKKYNTNYQGAVFLLRKGDKISVRIPFTKSYFMNRETSYFGAFLVSPAVNTTSVAESTSTGQDPQ